MNYHAISIYIGQMLLVEGVVMFPALVLALCYGERLPALSFLVLVLFLVVVGLYLSRQKRNLKEGMYAREGFVTVGLGWVLLSLFGALPYFFSGILPNFLDAWFESVSGITTTGASVLAQVENLPRSILYWRSFSLWLGGMGVLVFMLAIVPAAKGSGETVHLVRAEIPGPSVGRLTPRLSETARLLYIIYIALTVLQCILLLCGGMPLFDSITTAFSIAGTGGFSIKNAGFAAYNSTYITLVISVFMLLSGVNFTMFHMILMKQGRSVLRNEELRLYLAMIVVATAAVGLNIYPQYAGNAGHAALDGFFQVSSMITTTGCYTVDYNQWPQFSRFILLLLMVIGACAGSTGGGMKLTRVLLLAKGLKSQLQTMLRPRAIRGVRLDGKAVEPEVMRGVYAYVTAYIAICLVSILLLSLDNYSLETTVTSVIASINNIGPGFDLVGPTQNYALFSPLSKLVLSFNMLVGRLELFPMLLLFAPSTWKRKA